MEFLNNCLACNSNNHHAFIQTQAMMHDYVSLSYNFDKCDDCGLIFLNPRVPETELVTFYTSAYLPFRLEQAWGKYASFVKRDQHNIDKARVKRLKLHHKITSESRILDVGCGKPTFLSCLLKETSAKVTGLDFSDEGWKNDRHNYQDINLIQGEINDLKMDKPTDVITMWHYLEHDYHPQQNLKKLLDFSHHDTQLIIEVPNFNSYSRRRFGQHWSGYHTPRHTALYTKETLALLLQKSGWQVEHHYEYGTLDPYTLHWMSKMEQKKINWSANMEQEFIGFVAGKIMNTPIYMLQKYVSMGFLTVVAKPIKQS